MFNESGYTVKEKFQLVGTRFMIGDKILFVSGGKGMYHFFTDMNSTEIGVFQHEDVTIDMFESFIKDGYLV